jgi:hypothetical protein
MSLLNSNSLNHGPRSGNKPVDSLFVIASEAKQSIARLANSWIASSLRFSQ